MTSRKQAIAIGLSEAKARRKGSRSKEVSTVGAVYDRPVFKMDKARS